MFERSEILITVVVIILVIIIFILIFFSLTVAIANKRNSHQLEVDSLKLQKDHEVNEAEKEATQRTHKEIGREIHDNIGQLFTAAQLSLMNYADDIENDKLNVIIDTLGDGIKELSRLGNSLSDTKWQEKSLLEAIKNEAQRIERLKLLRVKINHDIHEEKLNPDEKIILFRAFQEVLNNAVKHSASEEVIIEYNAVPFQLQIKDNGKGFDLNEIKLGSGITNIKRRCNLLDITPELRTSIGKGTTWIFKKRTHEK